MTRPRMGAGRSMLTSKTVFGLMATTFALCLFVSSAEARSYKAIYSCSAQTCGPKYNSDSEILDGDVMGSFTVWLCFTLLQAAPGYAVAKPLNGPSEQAREKACRKKFLGSSK